MVDKNKEVVQYNDKVSAHLVSKRVYYNAPQTIKETIYKTKEEEEKELLWKVKMYKMGMTANIDQFEERKILKILKDEKRSH